MYITDCRGSQVAVREKARYAFFPSLPVARHTAVLARLNSNSQERQKGIRRSARTIYYLQK